MNRVSSVILGCDVTFVDFKNKLNGSHRGELYIYSPTIPKFFMGKTDTRLCIVTREKRRLPAARDLWDNLT